MLFPKVRIKCQLNDRNEGCGMREADVGVCVCMCFIESAFFNFSTLDISLSSPILCVTRTVSLLFD